MQKEIYIRYLFLARIFFSDFIKTDLVLSLYHLFLRFETLYSELRIVRCYFTSHLVRQLPVAEITREI